MNVNTEKTDIIYDMVVLKNNNGEKTESDDDLSSDNTSSED